MEQIINSGRGQGKMIAVLQWSADNGIPICCDDQEEKSRLVNLAKKVGIVIPEPMFFETKPREITVRSDNFGPSPLLNYLKSVQNHVLLQEMLKYRFKPRVKDNSGKMLKKLYPDGGRI